MIMRLIETTWSDIRYAFRQMARSPLFTIVAVAVLAVGIGVNSALFSFVDTLVLQPVPGIRDGGRVVEIIGHDGMMPYSAYEIIRDHATTYDGIAAATERQGIVDGGGPKLSGRIEYVNGAYFTTLQPALALGGALPAVKDLAAAPPSAVLGYNMWMAQFGGRRNVIGETIRVNEMTMTIVGVMAKEYFRNSDLYLPMSALPAGMLSHVDGADTYFPISFMAGRLRDDATLTLAQTQLTEIVRRLPPAGRYDPTPPSTVRALRRAQPADLKFVLGPIGFIGNATVFILLIAAANVGVLLLSRAVARRSEIGVRLALGAHRRRLIRQLITEGLLLSLMAAAAGLVFLNWAGYGFHRLFFPTLPFAFTASWITICVTLLVAVVTGLLFAIAPALHATRSSVVETLKAGGGGTLDPRSARLQHAFVIAEVALSMALVCTAGIFVDASLRSARRDQGLVSSPNIIAAEIKVEDTNLTPQQKGIALERMTAAVLAIPGVTGVTHVPMIPTMGSCCLASVVGAGQVNAQTMGEESLSMMNVSLNPVGSDLFKTIGVPLLQGRDILASDTRGKTVVAVVDEVFARSKWPGQNPLGQTISFRNWYPHMGIDTAVIIATVVGVARQLPEKGGTIPKVYISAEQKPDARGATLLVSTDRNAAPLVGSVVATLRGVDRNLPIGTVATMAQIYRQNHSRLFNARTLAVMSGLIALILACTGLYATSAFGLSQRVREIGVRRALGANDRDVVYTFFEGGMRLALIGFSIGVPVALAAMKIGVAEKFGVQMLTTSSIAYVLAALLSVCAFASWLPARRAARVDAITALKQE